LTDRYQGMSPSLSSPYVGGAAIAKSDSAAIELTRAIYVGGAGDLKVTYSDGSVDTLHAVPAGTLLQIRVSLVWSAGTTATLMSALY
jgi:hypothetical protein